MKIEDKLELIVKGTRPVRPYQNYPSLKDKDINELIEVLGKKGIEIDLANSQQEVNYYINDSGESAVVPFRTVFEDEVIVTGYILRNKQLEIILRDHHKRKGRTDVIGGAVYTEDGIVCSITFNGHYEEGKIVETIKEVLENFYRFDNEYFRKLIDELPSLEEVRKPFPPLEPLA